MNIEKIKEVKKSEDEAWSKLAQLNNFLTHLRTKKVPDNGNTYYPMEIGAAGTPLFKCFHPDTYRNEFNKSEINISANDIFSILNSDEDLRDTFFEKYRQMLLKRHEYLLKKRGETKKAALQAIESL